MPLLFRLEDSLITSNFQSLPRRSILSTSDDNQICMALIDKIYTFKHGNNSVKLTCKASSTSFPRNEINKYNQLKLDEKRSSYYEDLQSVMCTYCTLDNPRLVGIQTKIVNRLVWTCWTPRCKIRDEEEVCLLCTITINNAIHLWIPTEDETGTHLYKLENVLNISNDLINELGTVDFPVFGEGSDKEEAKKRVLFSLSTLGFSSCYFVEDQERREQGFLCLINLVDYILLVWLSKMKMKEEKKETEEVTGRRSTRSRRINIEEITDLYQEEEEEPPKKRKKKLSEKVLGLSGFSALNKDFYDIEYFDITKCKDLFPINTKLTYSNLLNCMTIAAVKVNSCRSLVALCRKQLNFDIYYSDTEGIKAFNLQFDLNVEGELLKVSNVRTEEIRSVHTLNRSLELMKYVKIRGGQENELLMGFYESTLLVHELNRNVTRQVACGSTPIVSYSLEHQFMDNGNLALINVVNTEGGVYRLLMDQELKIEIEEVVEKPKEFVPCFTTSGPDEVVVYDCLVKGLLLEVNYNLGNKSVFYNLVLLISKNADLDVFLDYVRNQRSNLAPNSTFFSVKETPNPFHELTEVEELLELSRSNDELYDSLLESYQCERSKTLVLTCFALYLFSFMEASGTTPFEKNVSVTSNSSHGPLVAGLLKGAVLDSSKLLKIFQTLNRIYKNKFLSELVNHLTT